MRTGDRRHEASAGDRVVVAAAEDLDELGLLRLELAQTGPEPRQPVDGASGSDLGHRCGRSQRGDCPRYGV